MEGVHLIHPDDYNPDDDRFFTTAFENNQGSLSFDSTKCIAEQPTTICDHIAKYFPQPRFRKVVGEPPVFWRFQTDQLPPSAKIKPSRGRNPCHYIAEGAANEELWPVFQGVTVSDLETCEKGILRRTKREDLIPPKDQMLSQVI